MRRSICYCEPSQALAGEATTWKFIYTPASALPKGTCLKFDFMSKGRDIDWHLPSVSLKKTSNVIYAQIEGQKTIAAEEVETPDSFTPQYEFTLPVKLEAGKSFTIVVGNPKESDAAKGKDGNTAQTYVQRRRPFLLYIDTTGKGRYGDPEIFTMDIRGNRLHTIRVLTPSFVAKNKRFDVTVRFEDEFGNLTSNAPDNTLIELSYENLRENLNWKLFVPETGFILLPNLYFNEAGIYTIFLKNVTSKEVFHSSPVKCFNETSQHIFWGTLHGESERIDSTENIESCLRHFRDDKALNFFATSCFESAEETSNDLWKLISQNITDFNEAERFVTLLGMQWCGEAKDEGLRHIIYNKDNKPILRQKDAKASSLKKLYKNFSPKEIISIPSFTMGKGFEYDFKNFDPDFERVVEIYNAWGSSECTAKEGNTCPIQASGKAGVQAVAEGSVQNALLQGHRFGFVAGGLDDRGIYANFFESDQEQYFPGMTAIIADTHSREALVEAIYNRSCYATTGERIIVGIYLAGLSMGKETSTDSKPGLAVNRHLSGYVAGTTTLKSVELIRNGKVITTFTSETYSLEFAYDDMIPLEKVCVQPQEKKPPFVYYYIRVTQEDGHVAWSSPIWIDSLPKKKKERPEKPEKKGKAAAMIAPIIIEEEEDDLDDDDE